MSKRYEIVTIGDLMDVVTDENVETLKYDVCEFLDFVASAKYLSPIMVMKRKFTWNDDGVKGIKTVHFTDKDGNTNSVDMPKESTN